MPKLYSNAVKNRDKRERKLGKSVKNAVVVRRVWLQLARQSATTATANVLRTVNDLVVRVHGDRLDGQALAIVAARVVVVASAHVVLVAASGLDVEIRCTAAGHRLLDRLRFLRHPMLAVAQPNWRDADHGPYHARTHPLPRDDGGECHDRRHRARHLCRHRRPLLVQPRDRYPPPSLDRYPPPSLDRVRDIRPMVIKCVYFGIDLRLSLDLYQFASPVVTVYYAERCEVRNLGGQPWSELRMRRQRE